MMFTPRVTGSARVFETGPNPHLLVERHTVALPGGLANEWYSVTAQGGVPGVVCVVVQNGRFLVGSHWRLATNKLELEFPRGFGETGEDPVSTAQRELLEETGMTAKSARVIGSFFADSGILRNEVTVVEMLEVARVRGFKVDSELADLEWRTPAELDTSLGKGHLRDGITICALALWRVHAS